ncbi:hypothetical protein EW146_g9397 [Bondarzewia mesenterica]|uniref:Uncharacterized protein n=1 Tax=Bondarzewia mesenterica TaxID=1095465 RepID=A0A4S4L8M5_9AGAM|nr:hypothetical protein EW146_g9397 [Bondarzewia mesenterica]
MSLDPATLTPQQQKALQRVRNKINEKKLYQEGDTLDSDDRTLLCAFMSISKSKPASPELALQLQAIPERARI